MRLAPAIVAVTVFVHARGRGHVSAQSASGTTQSPASPGPLILQEGDGEHRVRHFLSRLPFTIKVDEQFGNAQDFFVLTEILVPGGTIPFHMHHNAEEILILEEGGATVTVGDKRAVASPRSIVFIPRETWVSVTNSGKQSIHLYALFSRQGFERYLRAASVPEGQPVTPLSPDDLARLRATGHATFWDTSKRTLPARRCAPMMIRGRKGRGNVKRDGLQVWRAS